MKNICSCSQIYFLILTLYDLSNSICSDCCIRGQKAFANDTELGIY